MFNLSIKMKMHNYLHMIILYKLGMILGKELEILEKLQNDNIKFTYYLCKQMDLEFTEVNEKFEIIPISNHVKYFDNNFEIYISF